MSFITRNEVLDHIHKVFGKEIQILDATFPLRIQPLPVDVQGAVPKSPNNCVFVRTIKRMYGSECPILFKGIGYVDMVDPDGIRRVHRLIIAKDATRQMAEFDRGKPLAVGTAIVFKAPMVGQTLKAKRKRLTARKVETKKYEDRRKQFKAALVKKSRAAKLLDEQMKKATSNQKQDKKKIAGIRQRKEALEAALKATRDKVAAMDKSRAKRAPRTFDMTTRNGAIGNYHFTAAPGFAPGFGPAAAPEKAEAS